MFLKKTLYAVPVAFFLFAGMYSYAQGTSKNTKPYLTGTESNWRGVFHLSNGLEVPFNFSIKPNKSGNSRIYLRNADEKFDGGSVTQKDDSVFVALNQFDNEMAFVLENNTLKGELRRQDRTGIATPVIAERGIDNRFTETYEVPTGNISGKYDVRFALPEGKEEKAVGLFTQTGKKLTATFLRVTGDSRYLEGIVEGNRFYLSSFIGSGPIYYEGTFTSDHKINAEIKGARGSQAFSGIPDDNAALPDAYSLTLLKDGYTDLDFSFPDINGKIISAKDDKYRNKVLIITIGGTWCPNCIDETAFLSPWYNKNKDRGIEIISIQYERKTDPAYVEKVLTRFKERYDIRYDQLIGGVADKQKVAASLPALNTFLSFPTTIFIGKDGKVAKIHTGFTGPATGKYYDDFVQEFNAEVDALLIK
jgi:thiol-disulfide isomerase/thioredoxin